MKYSHKYHTDNCARYRRIGEIRQMQFFVTILLFGVNQNNIWADVEAEQEKNNSVNCFLREGDKFVSFLQGRNSEAESLKIGVTAAS